MPCRYDDAMPVFCKVAFQKSAYVRYIPADYRFQREAYGKHDLSTHGIPGAHHFCMGMVELNRAKRGNGSYEKAVEDFAYQALENLAFDKLEGTLNSLPGGRMQLIFHIVGYNDPAGAKPTEVDVISLVKGEAFQTPMPLPKGTAIDLTLDTNLNFDQILRAYRSNRR